MYKVLIIFILEILMRPQNLCTKRMWDYQRPWVITWRRGRCWRNWGTSFRRRMNSSVGTRNLMTWWSRRRLSKSNSRKNRLDRWNTNQGIESFNFYFHLKKTSFESFQIDGFDNKLKRLLFDMWRNSSVDIGQILLAKN